MKCNVGYTVYLIHISEITVLFGRRIRPLGNAPWCNYLILCFNIIETSLFMTFTLITSADIEANVIMLDLLLKKLGNIRSSCIILWRSLETKWVKSCLFYLFIYSSLSFFDDFSSCILFLFVSSLATFLLLVSSIGTFIFVCFFLWYLCFCSFVSSFFVYVSLSMLRLLHIVFPTRSSLRQQLFQIAFWLGRGLMAYPWICRRNNSYRNLISGSKLLW